MANLLFLHAHPDDEAIFTGGTIARLADLGHNITVVFGTGGQLGLPHADNDLEEVRKKEARIAAEILGVSHVEFLEYHDSGLDAQQFPDGAFATCDTHTAAESLAKIMANQGIEIAFFDDDNGIYGHPDHRKAHEVGLAACQMRGISQAYEFTVDAEQLHYLLSERHVVQDAFRSFDFTNSQLRDVAEGRVSKLGKTSIEITHHVPVNGAALLAKRKAMTAHSSQIPASVTELDEDTFADVYGDECFTRVPEFGDPDKRSAEILHDISR